MSQTVDSAIATRSAIDSALLEVSQIPVKIEGLSTNVSREVEEQMAATKKASQDLANFVVALPDVVDANLKVVQAIPGDVLETVDSTIKYAQRTSSEVITRTTNFPTYVTDQVEATVTGIKTDVNNALTTSKQVVQRIKAIVMAPFVFAQRVQLFVRELTREKDDLALDEDQLKILEAQALERSERAEIINRIRSAKKTVYRTVDALEEVVADGRRTPEKIKQIRTRLTRSVEESVASYRAIVDTIQRIPDRAVAVQKSYVETFEELKRRPGKTQREIVEGIEAFQANAQRTQTSLIRTGEYVWRVVTLEEAKAAVKQCQRFFPNASKSVAEIQAKLRPLIASTDAAKASKAAKSDSPVKAVKALSSMQQVAGASVDAAPQVDGGAQSGVRDGQGASVTPRRSYGYAFAQPPRNSTSLSADLSVVALATAASSVPVIEPSAPLAALPLPPSSLSALSAATASSAASVASVFPVPSKDGQVSGVVAAEEREEESKSELAATVSSSAVTPIAPIASSISLPATPAVVTPKAKQPTPRASTSLKKSSVKTTSASVENKKKPSVASPIKQEGFSVAIDSPDSVLPAIPAAAIAPLPSAVSPLPRQSA